MIVTIQSNVDFLGVPCLRTIPTAEVGLSALALFSVLLQKGAQTIAPIPHAEAENRYNTKFHYYQPLKGG